MSDAASLKGRYRWLWLFAIAFGWIEGAVVVYLRATYYPHGFTFPVVVIPDRLTLVEVIREAATMIVLVAVGRLSADDFHRRFGAFMLSFGIWDIVYYATLHAVLGWPPELSTWDILFLIPVPWVAPVWAPLAVSCAFVAIGSMLYLGPSRRYGAADWIVEIGAGAIVLASFLVEAPAAISGALPRRYPAALFWSGLAIGVGWFLWRERALRKNDQKAVQ
jgi:hypothetical protein